MKGRSYFLLSLVMIIGFLALDYHFQKKIIGIQEKLHPESAILAKAVAVSSARQPAASRAPDVAEVTADPTVGTASLQEFKKDFKAEALQIGQLQKDPEVVENRIQSLARQMEPAHIQYLKTVISDQSANGDDRAMAIELLTRNQTPDSMLILKDFAKSENLNFGTRPEYELSARAQAIESIGSMGSAVDRQTALTYLDEIKNTTNYGFLRDRATRVAHALKNNLPSVESQDNEALKKLVE